MKHTMQNKAFCVTVITVTVLMLAFGTTEAQTSSTPTPTPPPPRWAYAGDNGPEHWGDLSPLYAACGQGKAQSPIDIPSDIPSDATSATGKLEFNYKSTVLTVEGTDYSVQVDFNKDNSLSYNGTVYTLNELHFHQPSEHTIGGKSFPMELQLVHTDAGHRMLIVSVLIAKGQGNYPGLESLWLTMRNLKPEPWTVLGISINPADFLPEDRSYYSYVGSLTTPPCTEGVQWIVMQNPIPVSSRQITPFTNVYLPSARPTQPLNGREVDSASQ